MKKILKLIGIAAVPVMAAGWAAFRPELLFVNNTVNEKLVAEQGSTVEEIGKGTFESYAHETKGMAKVLRLNNKNFVSLENFSTSNGPDVHLYLLQGSDSSQSAVKDSNYIDLGVLKGNIGSQNYEIPAGTDLSKFSAVSIWCARFSVAFGGAVLKKESPTAYRNSFSRLAAFNAPIEVTSGKISGEKSFVGRISLIEDAGKRYIETNFSKAMPLEIRFLKKESISKGAFPDVPFQSLGKAMTGKHRISVSKDLDAWLYRSIAVVSADGKIVAFANLRSAQEKKADLSLI